MNKFATSINCIDGRVQIPIIEYIKNKYQVDYVDMLTQPGVNKLFADRKDILILEAIKKSVEISVNRYNSKLIAIIGHYDCAGNPVNKEEHIKQIKLAIEFVNEWHPNVKVIGLWVNESWQIEEIG